MKFFHIIACLILIYSCSFLSPERKRDVMSAPQQMDSTYMAELNYEQPLLWTMIKEVIDTINYYRCQMQPMPEAVIGDIWNRFWTNESVRNTCPTAYFDAIGEYQADTFRIGWLNRCMRQYSFSVPEKIVLGDCKINLCRFLEKKYLRLMCLLKFDIQKDNWDPYNSPAWKSFYESSVQLTDSVLMNDKNISLFREIDKQDFVFHIEKSRLQIILDMYMIIMDPNYEVNFDDNKEVDMNTLNDLLFENIRLASFQHHCEIIYLNHVWWKHWYKSCEDERNKMPTPEMRRKSEMALKKLVYCRYRSLKLLNECLRMEKHIAP